MPGFVSTLNDVGTQFLSGTYLVDTLPTPGPQYLNTYARVTDLFGEKTDVVLCSMVGGTYFWQPVRQSFAKSISLASSNLVLTTMKSPSIVLANGTLTSNRTVQLSTQYAYPGASFEVAFEGVLGIFSLNILGPTGTILSSLLTGGRKRYFFADGAWSSF